MENIFKIIKLKKKKDLIFLFFFMILTSFFETLTIGVFFPVVSLIIGGKSSFESLNFLNNFDIIQNFIIHFNENDLVIISLIIFFLIFVIKNFLVMYFNWFKESFNFSLRHSLSKNIFGNHILKNTELFFKKNSSEYTSQTIFQSSQAIDSINSLIYLLNELIVFLFIFILLVSLDFKVTLFSISIFIIFLFPFLFISKIKIKNWASKKIINEKDQIKNLNESFSMFKFIKIHNLEKNFFEKFKDNNFFVNHYSKLMTFFYLVPRHIMEVLTILIISLIIIFYLYNNQSPSDSLPLIAIFLLAASRIVPSINRISNSIQTFIAGLPSLNSISREINSKKNNLKKIKSFKKFNNLEFKNVKFSYRKNKIILNNLSFKINAGDKIIIRGPSGVGKSTLIELILGLRSINKGLFYFNNKKIKNFKLYQQIKFNYLPQSSYIIDGTIKNNILLNNQNLSNKSLNKIINICKLNSLIKNLKKRENTLTGENGIALSGGQKQRICIARALADNPTFLILDESTNAIDMSTEKLILKELIKNYKNITLIMVTHRKTDNNNFNKIIDINNKKIKVIKKNV